MNKKRMILHVLLYAILFSILLLNSITIVEWLNRSLSFVNLEPNTYNEYVLKYEEPETHNFNPVKRARNSGFIPSLLHTIKPNYQDKPVGYSKRRAKQIEEKYQEVADDINQNRYKSLASS